MAIGQYKIYCGYLTYEPAVASWFRVLYLLYFAGRINILYTGFYVGNHGKGDIDEYRVAG